MIELQKKVSEIFNQAIDDVKRNFLEKQSLEPKRFLVVKAIEEIEMENKRNEGDN